MGSRARPHGRQPSVAGTGFEQDRYPGRSDGFDVDVGLQSIGDVTFADQRGRAHQAAFFRVGDEDEERPSAIRPCREKPGRLERHRHTKCVVGCARRFGDRVEMGQQADGFGALTRQDAHDVRDPHRLAEIAPSCVRFLHADIEPQLFQLFDDVRAGPRIGRTAGRPAADGAGQHADVSSGVLFREDGRRSCAAGKHEGCDRQ